MTEEKENESGEVSIQDGIIYWDYENEHVLSFHLDDVVIIGEYTNSDGPYFDDWFLVFLLKDNKEYSISMYAGNVINDVIDKLSAWAGYKIQNYLTASTKWDSKVLYPRHLSGETLYFVRPSKEYNPPKTRLQSFLYNYCGWGKFNTSRELVFNPLVRAELDKATNI